MKMYNIIGPSAVARGLPPRGRDHKGRTLHIPDSFGKGVDRPVTICGGVGDWRRAVPAANPPPHHRSTGKPESSFDSLVLAGANHETIRDQCDHAQRGCLHPRAWLHPAAVRLLVAG